MANLLWLQGGACWGDASSFLNADEPNACDLVTDFGVKVLWRPAFGVEPGDGLQRMLKGVLDGAIVLDVLVFEGAVVEAPDGAGEWHRFAGRPMKDWVADLRKAARHVVTLCGRAPVLGEACRPFAGPPPINIPGRPTHDRIAQIVIALASGRAADVAPDDIRRSKAFVSGTGGRLSYGLGCRGPARPPPRSLVRGAGARPGPMERKWPCRPGPPWPRRRKRPCPPASGPRSWSRRPWPCRPAPARPSSSWAP